VREATADRARGTSEDVPGDNLDACGIVLANRCESAEVAVSTRTYILLAALTGVVILVAFTLQVVLAGK
jgi:hypothetical protein